MYFVRPQCQTSCLDVEGQVDFQLQSAACTRCRTPVNASRRKTDSVRPAEPMALKTPTPPVRKIEVCLTFEPTAPSKSDLHLIHWWFENRRSSGLPEVCIVSLTILAACPEGEHVLEAGAARAACCCTNPHAAATNYMKSAATLEIAYRAGRGAATNIAG